VDIRSEVAQILNLPVADIETLGGGCISDVYLVRLSDGTEVVAKVDDQGLSGLAVEGRMLNFLSDQTTLPVPAVLHCSEHLLILEYIEAESRFTIGAEYHAAELLANLHVMTSASFGFEYDTRIGGLHQPNPFYPSWIAFFREQRLFHMARLAVNAGRLPGHTLQRIERFGAHLERWLAEPDTPSLIHGDVWTTNVLSRGDRIYAFLDPAIYFAHAEIELAFISLFNTFGRSFFQRYHEHRTIAPGFFEERRDIYNLYPLLVHVRLFGGSYVSAVERTLSRFGF
jgi:fructosamine-3-kinase